MIITLMLNWKHWALSSSLNIKTFLLNIQNNVLEWCLLSFWRNRKYVSIITALNYTTQKNLLLSVPHCYIISSVPQWWGSWRILYLLYQISFILTVNVVITSRVPQARLYLYTWRYLCYKIVSLLFVFITSLWASSQA